MWGAYLSSPKLAAAVRQRLELARLEAPAEWHDGLEEVAAVRLRELEGERPAPMPAPAPASADPPGADEEGSWWW